MIDLFFNRQPFLAQRFDPVVLVFGVITPRPVIDQSYAWGLVEHFDDLEAHDAYQVDPDHHVFIDSFKSWWARVEVRDLQKAGQ